MSTIRKSSNKHFLFFLSALVFVVFCVGLFSKNSLSRHDDFLDPVAQEKAKILAMVSATDRPQDEIRRFVSESLSGEKMLKYNFSPAEKKKIISVLNKK